MHRIFKWNRRGEWSKSIFTLLADKLDDAVLKKISSRSPRYLRDDHFAWLNESVASVKESCVEDIPSLLATRLKAHYAAVIAFHGCRPLSLGPYRTHGLKPSDTEGLRQLARSIFGDTPALADVVAGIGRDYEAHNHGTLWLGLTKEPFLQRPHEGFLLHGSEYLALLADRLGQGEWVRHNGIPTIVECLVLTREVPEDFWLSLSKTLLEDWFSEFLRLRERRPLCTMCLNVASPIPPERIVRFHQFRQLHHTYSWTEVTTGMKQIGEMIKFSYLPIAT